jgi:hypothetical protein
MARTIKGLYAPGTRFRSKGGKMVKSRKASSKSHTKHGWYSPGTKINLRKKK